MVSNTPLDSLHMTQSLPLQGANSSIVTLNDNFIEGDTFEVVLKRNSLGLGLSVTGGPEAPAPFTNLIRVKKVFPMQPAWESGQFQEGDILISAGGQPLSGLTLRQALDVLRSSPPVTTIFVCRPRAEQFLVQPEHQLIKQVQTGFSNKRIRSYSFTPASIQHSLSVCDEDQDQDMDVQVDPEDSSDPNMYKSNNNYGEFIVSLSKINGSLGFSLRSDPEDTTALRHSIKALVKEPAISDGRIRPGDKLISANGYECGAMSHADLISFLRSLPEESVELKLYRDASRAQTPISTPTESEFSRSHPNLTFLNSASSFSSSSGRSKQLRHEAKEMVRSLQASRTSLDGAGLSGSIGRKLNRPFSPSLTRKSGPHPLSNSSSSPLVMKQYSCEEPVIETPLSPENEQLPYQQCFTSSDNNQHRQGLQIEEIIDDTHSSLAMEIENMIEDFECVFKQEVSMDDEILEESPSPTPPPARPNHLDLFSPEKHCRPSYSFKNPH